MDGTRGSGCGKKEKGDTKDDTWCGEGKSTRGDEQSIRVSEDMLDKVWKDGQHMGAIPFIDMDFTREARTRRPRHWVLVPGPVFQVLKDRLTEAEKEMLKP